MLLVPVDDEDNHGTKSRDNIDYNNNNNNKDNKGNNDNKDNDNDNSLNNSSPKHIYRSYTQTKSLLPLITHSIYHGPDVTDCDDGKGGDNNSKTVNVPSRIRHAIARQTGEY